MVALEAQQKVKRLLRRGGKHEGAPFDGILLALGLSMLAENRTKRAVEAFRGRFGHVALLYPAEHVLLVVVGAAALRGVEVRVAPWHKLKVDCGENPLGGERVAQDAGREVLALGSGRLPVEGNGGGRCGREGEESEEELGQHGGTRSSSGGGRSRGRGEKI